MKKLRTVLLILLVIGMLLSCAAIREDFGKEWSRPVDTCDHKHYYWYYSLCNK